MGVELWVCKDGVRCPLDAGLLWVLHRILSHGLNHRKEVAWWGLFPELYSIILKERTVEVQVFRWTFPQLGPICDGLGCNIFASEELQQVQ